MILFNDRQAQSIPFQRKEIHGFRVKFRVPRFLDDRTWTSGPEPRPWFCSWLFFVEVLKIISRIKSEVISLRVRNRKFREEFLQNIAQNQENLQTFSSEPEPGEPADVLLISLSVCSLVLQVPEGSADELCFLVELDLLAGTMFSVL
ncbi:hypothetical protein FQA47_004136 [Oryzias melastigma]|uniref:Uncharacterized protein n=1 Tax=Oryzias melastigma TaxID=30732 RepID=A0A834FCH8_ORYME|nr:hypothetical protein FQA47_004136 [Oryzias melastigma]